MGETTDWSKALGGADAVVHLAARVHVMGERPRDALAAARRVNLDGTCRLAEQAATAGVKRFIFTSTLKVHGEASGDHPFTENDAPAPIDPYAISKWEAEQELSTIAGRTGMELVILRPPLVYGPGVKANFLELVKACAEQRYLPFGRVNNRRSILFVGNLADAIAACVDTPAAAGGTFLIRDDGDLSTPEMVRQLSHAVGAEPRLGNVPVALLRLAGFLTGRRAMIDRLVGSLAVNDTKIRRQLGWQPPATTTQGFAETASWYLKSQPSS